MIHPFVTVIIPIRNEAKYIKSCLQAVIDQDYPNDRIEILVVDGLSEDSTRDIVTQMAKQAPTIRLLDNPGQIVPTALNIGLKKAQGEVIIRVDGHTIIASDYVHACVEALQASQADCVGGPMIAQGQTPFGEAVALATSHPFGVGGSRFHYATDIIETETAYMGAYQREVFEKVGYFDEEMVRNQDDEFHYRLRARGGRIMLYPTIRSIYYNRSTTKSLWKQYFQYGFWKVRVAQKLPRQIRPRHLIPAGLVVSLFLGGLLAPFSKLVRWGWLAIISLYAILNLGVSLKISAQTSWLQFKFLPLTFSILHLAYGSGFVWGVIRFIKRWK